MGKKMNLFIKAILAGVCISIGGIANLSVNGGIVGAILFTFGLLAVVHYKYSLYTGMAGFVNDDDDIKNLFCIVLPGNVIGCILCGLTVVCTMPEITRLAEDIVSLRSSTPLMSALVRGIFCGILMTTAVMFAKKDHYLPLLWAVPAFILSGFYHSIADAFYIVVGFNTNYMLETFATWVVTVIGNFIGCNIPRLPKIINN